MKAAILLVFLLLRLSCKYFNVASPSRIESKAPHTTNGALSAL